MKNVFFLSGLILTSFMLTGCLATGQQGSHTSSSGQDTTVQPFQSDRTATEAERRRVKRDRGGAPEEPARPRERETPAESAVGTNCTGGKIWMNNRCECRSNFYWNERLNQCRPVATCSPGKQFDREIDGCVASCTGGKIWMNNRCECRPNFYWNERLNQCRPVATCPPGKRFDREIDGCVAK